MVMPKLTLVPHSFLHCHLGDNLQNVRYGFSARLNQVQLAGALVTYTCSGHIIQDELGISSGVGGHPLFL